MGGADRKHSGGRQAEGSALASVVGIVLDGIPESIVLGLTIGGLAQAGWAKARILDLWGLVAVVSGLAALLGFVAFDSASAGTIAFVLAFAGGAILTMLDTMMPRGIRARRTSSSASSPPSASDWLPRSAPSSRLEATRRSNRVQAPVASVDRETHLIFRGFESHRSRSKIPLPSREFRAVGPVTPVRGTERLDGDRRCQPIRKTAALRRFHGASRTRTGDLLGAISALSYAGFGLSSGFRAYGSVPQHLPQHSAARSPVGQRLTMPTAGDWNAALAVAATRDPGRLI
jgi:hypothetical protein